MHLVIEVDGGQHFTEEGKVKDAERDEHLKSLGLQVLRFSNADVLENLGGVLAMIVQYLEQALDTGR